MFNTPRRPHYHYSDQPLDSSRSGTIETPHQQRLYQQLVRELKQRIQQVKRESVNTGS